MSRLRSRQGQRLRIWAFVTLLLLGLYTSVPTGWQAQPTVIALRWLLQVTALLVLPGWALTVSLGLQGDHDLAETLCLIPIVSLALLPLLLFWLDLLGGHWTGPAVKLFLVACVLVFAWRAPGNQGAATTSRNAWHLGGLGLVFAVTLTLRWLAVRGMIFPSWVDSYHHTIITQLILDRGIVPTGYQPYAEISSFVYHFGYHAYSAFIGWATGLPAHNAVLWGGQILNALTVPSLYYLVSRLTQRRRPALIAALLAGLVFRMPAYYVNFGRYPQLAGQVLLPVALALAVQAFRQGTRKWPYIVLAGVFAGALGITHYRIAIFYLVGVVVICFADLARIGSNARSARWALLKRIAAVAAIGALLVLPWMPRLLSKTVATAQTVLASSDGGQYDYVTLDLVEGFGLQRGTWIATACASIWALVRARRRPVGALVLVWLTIMVFLANPAVSGLPNGFLPNGTLILALYLPAAVLIGLALDDLADVLQAYCAGMDPPRNGQLGRAPQIVLILGMLAAALGGAADQVAHGIEPWYQLVTDVDVRAMAWIERETPESAVFAISGEGWLDSAAIGNDAGLWLPYLARRGTLIPPMIYVSEGDPSYVTQVGETMAALTDAQSAQAIASVLRESGATHVYLGQRGDHAWATTYQDETAFVELYRADNVRIYALR